MVERDIIELLEETFVEYAAPILCNNLPSIDGLLPVNRKVIWGMNEAKITHDKPFAKMLRATGHILPYYTFGDMPLTSAMKNMGNNSVNITYLLPKGAFGDKRRKGAKGASARYIECKLSEYAEDMLKGIDKNAVPMKRNYDNTKDEPVILPSKLPNILINTSQSIAVGESSKIPSHNVNEVCDAFIEYLKTKDVDKTIQHLNGADFNIGGQIINDRKNFEKIYKTGKGSFRLVGKYKYDSKKNELIIYEVPYEAYIENIESEIRDKVEKGIFKEVLDTHDATDKNGLKLIIYLRKNIDIDNFILKLRKHTSFEKTFSCNFTVLDLDGKTPKLMTLKDIIETWRTHRHKCMKNELEYDIKENQKRLNRLYGLRTISLDLDKAISIIRSSKKESEAIDNLKQHFNLNQEQCEYISTIRLVNINQDWIVKQIKHIEELEEKNELINTIIEDENKIDQVIIDQLLDCKKKYGRSRMTTLLEDCDLKIKAEELLLDSYNCQIQLSEQGYFKKTKLTGLKATTNKLKDDDEIMTQLECKNTDELLLFCEDLNVYKYRLHELEETKLSNLGQYMFNDTKSKILGMSVINPEYKYVLICYNNGNFAKISLDSYKTKQNRKLLSKSLADSDVFGIYTLKDDCKVSMIVSDGRESIIGTNTLTLNKSRNSSGSKQMKWKRVHIKNIEIL